MLKTTGKPKVYATGAQRDNREGKGMFSLIPPISLINLARHFEAGRATHSDPNELQLSKDNWKKGIPLADIWDSTMRHFFKARLGMTDEDHESAALWGVVVFGETKRRIEAGMLPKSLDNFDPADRDLVEALNIFEDMGTPKPIKEEPYFRRHLWRCLDMPYMESLHKFQLDLVNSLLDLAIPTHPYLSFMVRDSRRGGLLLDIHLRGKCYVTELPVQVLATLNSTPRENPSLDEVRRSFGVVWLANLESVIK